MIKQTILLLLGFLGGSLQGAAQNIVAAEYFFDIDPGVNNATGIIISNCLLYTSPSPRDRG